MLNALEDKELHDSVKGRSVTVEKLSGIVRREIALARQANDTLRGDGLVFNQGRIDVLKDVAALLDGRIEQSAPDRSSGISETCFV